MIKSLPYHLNFGPQHPSAHGVLRLVIEMIGEQISKISPHIGLLHRGTEKLIETKTVLQSLPYFDRLDYVSMLFNEHLFCLANELSSNTNVPLRAQQTRILFSELTRLLNHLMAVTTHAMDVGALTPFLWGFEEREKLMEFYERVSGARMHAAFFRPGGISSDLPKGLLDDMYIFFTQFFSRLVEINELLASNRIWKYRLKNVGIIDKNFAENYSFSGVMLRSSGKNFDLRIHNSYEIYNEIDFVTFVGNSGDCFDRFVQRMKEMDESTRICLTIINNFCSGSVKNLKSKPDQTARLELKSNMENLISHFKYYSEGTKSISNSEYYVAVEAPKGEFGVFLVNKEKTVPIYRCKIRAPGFFHLAAIDKMSRNLNLADVVTIIGTQDIVFGEVDR